MQYQIVPVTPFQENCSIVWCPKTMQAVIVDPGGEADLIQKQLTQLALTPVKILLTHGHLDHVGGAVDLAAHYQIPIYGPAADDRFLFEILPQQSTQFGLAYCPAYLPDEWLKEGDTITFGEASLQAHHCPGHTPGHIVLVNVANKIAFVGDVLFHGGIGRTDFPGGNYEQIMHSICQKLLPLGDEITFVPGHGPTSTFGYERRHNPFVLQYLSRATIP